jgi:hypothetical protein
MPTFRQFVLAVPCVLAVAGTVTVGARQLPPSGQTVRLGAGKMDNQCKNVSFTPLAPPVAFPSGTTEIAYQVEAPRGGIVDDVSGEVTIACGAGAVNQRRCEKWDVVGGSALLTSFTVIVSCGELKQPASPFKPGSYKLTVSQGGVPVETRGFTVDK